VDGKCACREYLYVISGEAGQRILFRDLGSAAADGVLIRPKKDGGYLAVLTSAQVIALLKRQDESAAHHRERLSI
jgi:hypothetical protein